MQAINWKMKKTVNQLGEKDKLEIKKVRKQSTKRARKASWKSKNRENSQPRGRERQAGNQKIEKTVNQEGEKGKLEIKKLRKQSTKRARKASWKLKNWKNSQPRGREKQAGNQKMKKTVNQEGKWSKLCLAVACCMREYERICLVRFDKFEKKC